MVSVGKGGWFFGKMQSSRTPKTSFSQRVGREFQEGGRGSGGFLDRGVHTQRGRERVLAFCMKETLGRQRVSP